MESELEKSVENLKWSPRILLDFIVGITAVFLLMPMINHYIFAFFNDSKASYYLSIISSNLLFVIVILLIKFRNHVFFNDLGWRRVSFFPALKSVLIVLAVTWLMIIAYMITIYYAGITSTDTELVKLLQHPTVLNFAANILLIAAVAPIVEETLFRGILFGSLRKYMGEWTAIIISAVVFAALHLDTAGFFPKFVLGIGLGYLYKKHHSIYPSIGMHAINNLMAVLAVSVS